MVMAVAQFVIAQATHPVQFAGTPPPPPVPVPIAPAPPPPAPAKPLAPAEPSAPPAPPRGPPDPPVPPVPLPPHEITRQMAKPAIAARSLIMAAGYNVRR